MCNLYSVTKGQAAIIALTRAMRDRTGNLPSLPCVFPDYSAPIVRNAPDGVRELTMARWGMPSSQKAMLDATKKRAQKLEAKGKPVDFNELLRMEPDGGTTNIRNTVKQALEALARSRTPLPRAIHFIQRIHGNFTKIAEGSFVPILTSSTR